MNRKGITPIVATVLLMLMAVAAVGSASVFLDDTLTGLQENLEGDLEEEQTVEASDLRIQSAYRGADGNINIDVRNSGSVTLNIEEDGSKLWNLYIDGRPQSWEYVGSSRGGDESITPNEVISLDTNTGYPSSGSSKELSLNGPFETEDTYICFNGGGPSC